MVQGVSPQGRAINEGVRGTSGRILVIVDDDSCLADEHVLSRLLETLEADPKIGMAGASIVPDPSANAFSLRAARQFPRFSTPIVSEITDSDLACHGCCAIPRSVFEEIGGEREDILRGLDPDLRSRLRVRGYRVVLAPQCRIHHPMPSRWPELTRIFFRNGYGSAYSQKFEPDSIIETSERLNSPHTPPDSGLAFRVLRFPIRLLAALFSGKWIRFVAYVSYATGYAWGLAFARRVAHVPATESGET
jgi:GT2 family glycosyltransferase